MSRSHLFVLLFSLFSILFLLSTIFSSSSRPSSSHRKSSSIVNEQESNSIRKKSSSHDEKKYPTSTISAPAESENRNSNDNNNNDFADFDSLPKRSSLLPPTSWRPLDCFDSIVPTQTYPMLKICKTALSSQADADRISRFLMKQRKILTHFAYCNNITFPWLDRRELLLALSSERKKNKNNTNNEKLTSQESSYELPLASSGLTRKFCFLGGHGVFHEKQMEIIIDRVLLEKRFLNLAKRIRKQASSSSGCPLDPKEFLDLVTQKGELVETGPPSQTTLLDLRIPNKCEHSLRFERLDLLALLSRVATNNKRFLGTKSLKERNRLLQPFAIVGDSPARQLFFRYVNFLRLGDKQINFDTVVHDDLFYIVYTTTTTHTVGNSEKQQQERRVVTRDFLGSFQKLFRGSKKQPQEKEQESTENDAASSSSSPLLANQTLFLDILEPILLSRGRINQKEQEEVVEIEILLKIFYTFDPFDTDNKFLDLFSASSHNQFVPPCVFLLFKSYWFVNRTLEKRSSPNGPLNRPNETEDLPVILRGAEKNILDTYNFFTSTSKTATATSSSFRFFVFESLPIRPKPKFLSLEQIQDLNNLLAKKNAHKRSLVNKIIRDHRSLLLRNASSSSSSDSIDLVPFDRVFLRKMSLKHIKEFYSTDAVHFASVITGRKNQAKLLEGARANPLDEINSWKMFLSSQLLLRHELGRK